MREATSSRRRTPEVGSPAAIARRCKSCSCEGSGHTVSSGELTNRRRCHRRLNDPSMHRFSRTMKPSRGSNVAPDVQSSPPQRHGVIDPDFSGAAVAGSRARSRPCGGSVHRTNEQAFPDACGTSVHRSSAPRGFLRMISSHLAASWLLSARLNSPGRSADFSASVLLPHEEYRTGRLGLTGEVRPVVVIELNCVCRSFMPARPAEPSRPSGPAHRNLR